jgi:hypothetical protein
MRITALLILLTALLLISACAHNDFTVLESAETLPAGKLRFSVGAGLSQNLISGLHMPQDSLWTNDDPLLPESGIGMLARPKLKVGLGKNWEAALSGYFGMAPDSSLGFMDTGLQTSYQLKASAKKVWDLNPCHSLAIIPTLSVSDGAWQSKQAGDGHQLWLGASTIGFELPMISTWHGRYKGYKYNLNFTLRPAYTALNRQRKYAEWDFSFPMGGNSWSRVDELEREDVFRLGMLAGLEDKGENGNTIFELGLDLISHSEKMYLMPLVGVSYQFGGYGKRE